MLKLLGVLAILAMIKAHGHHHDEPKASVFAEILKHQPEDDVLSMSQLKSVELTLPMIYACTTLAILSISILPAMLLCCIPVRNSNGQFLKFLLAFGAGGLLGDAVLHIIPHAMIGHQHVHEEHEHGHHHHHHHEEDGHSHEHGAHNHGAHDHSHQLMIGVYVIAGILTFMIFEQFTRIFRGANDHNHCHHHHELQHLETRKTEHENEEEEENEDTHKKEKTIKSSAYLNLVADFMHNITDGLAIGASFSINLYMGLLATFTVLIHELPHEIGDFAILVQSGFTKFQAIRLQFYTAFGALFGGYIAIWMAKDVDVINTTANLWIMPFTAGGFIYIATVSIIPEILEVNLQHSMKKKILCSILNILFFVSGVFMMYLVAKFE